MASYNERVSAEWQNVANAGGSGFVPDVTAYMSLETMRDNLNKVNYWIQHYQQSPVPPNLVDLYNKEISGSGTPITPVVQEIIVYLRTKQAFYQQAIAQAEPKVPVYEQNKPVYEAPDETQQLPEAPELEEKSFLEKNAIPLGIAAVLLINAFLPKNKQFIKL